MRIHRLFVLVVSLSVSEGKLAWQLPWGDLASLMSRRDVLEDATSSSVGALASILTVTQQITKVSMKSSTQSLLDSNRNVNGLYQVTDPRTFSAVAYAPPITSTATTINASTRSEGAKANSVPPPLILVLHGAGKNDKPDVFDELVLNKESRSTPVEHGGLIPNIIAEPDIFAPPPTLLDRFAVLAPYSGVGTTGFYELPRRSLLDFLAWAASPEGQSIGNCPAFDPQNVILFGFSDGATVAVELLTSRSLSQNVAGAILCSYGYSGERLPPQALQRLTNIPFWVFHAQDDSIFDVKKTSDRLVQQLRQACEVETRANNKDVCQDRIRYSRFRSGGHVGMGVAASTSPDVYDWLWQQVEHRRSQVRVAVDGSTDDRYDGAVP